MWICDWRFPLHDSQIGQHPTFYPFSKVDVSRTNGFSTKKKGYCII